MEKKEKDLFESIADLIGKILKEIFGEVRNERMDRIGIYCG